MLVLAIPIGEYTRPSCEVEQGRKRLSMFLQWQLGRWYFRPSHVPLAIHQK